MIRLSQQLARKNMLPLVKSTQIIPTQERPFYGMVYNLLMRKGQPGQQPGSSGTINQMEDEDPQLNIKAARDKYVQEQTREMLYSMKQDSIPKGVIFSSVLMSAPLFALTGYLGCLAPMAANPAFVDPVQFAYLARSSVRLLALNVAFIGGVHYGLASATYETAVTDQELLRIKYQMLYSFVPAALAFSSSAFLLFACPLTVKHVVFGFTSLMLTQLVTLQVDLKCVEQEMAPRWFLKYRSITFSAYMILTAILFAVFYSRMEQLQRARDPNRISTIKSAMELEDADFIQMVNELKLDYDDVALQEVEREVNNKLSKSSRAQQI